MFNAWFSTPCSGALFIHQHGLPCCICMQKQYFMQLDERMRVGFLSLLSTRIQNPRIPEIKCNVNSLGRKKTKTPTDIFHMICFNSLSLQSLEHYPRKKCLHFFFFLLVGQIYARAVLQSWLVFNTSRFSRPSFYSYYVQYIKKWSQTG